MSASKSRSKRERAVQLQAVNRLENMLVEIRRLVKRIGCDLEIRGNGAIWLDGQPLDIGDIRGIAIEILELVPTENEPG
jgi:hypothetical protein